MGREILQIVEDRDFPVNNIFCLASIKSKGKELDFKGKKLIVEDLILHERCELPRYDLAMRTHLSFLIPMKEWLSKNNIVTEVDFPFT